MSPVHSENGCYLRPCKAMQQLKKKLQIKSQEIKKAKFFVTKYRLVTSLVQVWVHMQFSQHTGTRYIIIIKITPPVEVKKKALICKSKI